MSFINAGNMSMGDVSAVRLLSNGVVLGTATLLPSANGWKVTFNGLNVAINALQTQTFSLAADIPGTAVN